LWLFSVNSGFTDLRKKYFLGGKMMKRLMVILLALVTAVSVFAGGSRNSGQTASRTARGPKGTLPLSDGSVTFSVFIRGLTDTVTSFDYKDNLFTKKVVDETGINLEFIASNSADANQKRNILLSSGDYPDLIMDWGWDMPYYASQGILVPLDDYNILSYPNIKAAFDQYPALYDLVRGSDGKIYGLPSVNDCFHCHYSHGRALYYIPWVRDSSRMKRPETLDELTAYLRYVRDNDLNGNGNTSDEIPMAFEKGYTRHAIAIIAKAYMPFIFNGDYFGLSLNDSRQVTEQYKDSRYRDALKYLAGLYKERLIAPESFTQTQAQLRAMMDGPDPTVAVWMSASPDNAISRMVDYLFLPPLAGPAGLRHASYRGPWDGLGFNMAVTNKCEDPELAVALYDYLLGFEVELNGYIGPKGVAWTEPDPNSLSLMGEKPLYKLLYTFGRQPVNGGWNQANPTIRTSAFRLGEQAADAELAKRYVETGDPSLRDRMKNNPSYNEEMLYFSTQSLFAPYKIDDKYFIPPLRMNENDTVRSADIKADLETFKEQAAVEFIIGGRDINSDAAWNGYLAELDRLGSKELAGIIQKYIK
jgi:putative aldouronate transport system substrate-binding protein